MYNFTPNNIESASTNNYITESRIIKAKDIETLIERANEFVNGRAAKFGTIMEQENWLFMTVDILSISYSYAIQPNTIKWTFNGTGDHNPYWGEQFNKNINVYDDGHINTINYNDGNKMYNNSGMIIN